MIKPMSIEVVFTEESTATGGGRDGHVKSSDGRIDLDTRPPKEAGGNGEGTNPEQLFSAGYAACFLGALRLVARNDDIKLDDVFAFINETALFKGQWQFKQGRMPVDKYQALVRDKVRGRDSIGE